MPPHWFTHRAKNAERKASPLGNARSAAHDSIGVRFLLHQKNSALTKWFHPAPRTLAYSKAHIVALARKLLIALWRLVREALSRMALFCVRHNERRR